MTRTKLLLTGLLAGAMAFATACKTDQSHTNTNPDQTSMPGDAGTGGTGLDNPDRSRQGVNPVPEEGTRELEPGVHEEPGTGGTGLHGEPHDESDTLTGEDPLHPHPSTTEPLPEDEGLHGDDSTAEPKR
jgi:hypothetical protein